MFAGGGLPPEFAHIFAHSMGGGRRGQRGRGPDLFDVFTGGFPGGGATFSFHTTGFGGNTFHYSNGNGHRRRNGDPRNLEEEEMRRRQQQVPQTPLEYCFGLIKQCAYMMFLS